MADLSYVLCAANGATLSRASALKDPARLRWGEISRLVVSSLHLATHQHSYSPIEVLSGEHTFVARRLHLGCETSAYVAVFFGGNCDLSACKEGIELNNDLRERAGFQLFYLCHLLKGIYGGLLLNVIGRVQEAINERMDVPSFTGHAYFSVDNNNVDAQILSAMEASGALPALTFFEDHFVNKFLALSYLSAGPGVDDSRQVIDTSFGLFSALTPLVMRYCDSSGRHDVEELFGVYLFCAASHKHALICELQHTVGPPNIRLKELVTSIASSSTGEIVVVPCEEVCVVLQSYSVAGLAVVQVMTLPVRLVALLQLGQQTTHLPYELEVMWHDVAKKIVTALDVTSSVSTSNLERLPEISALFEAALFALNYK